jgi:pimeloyl-ACP methyl ester carboxylesterase
MSNSQNTSPKPRIGKLHTYADRLVAFEHESQSPTSNLIFFVGGLSDGLLTVKYPGTLAETLPKGWGVVEIALSSSLECFGFGSLRRDVQNIVDCVTYFRNLLGEKTKIILMGHSTGCQDAMEYISGIGKESRPRLNGVILQACVSDREVAVLKKETYDDIVKAAQNLVDDGKRNELLPFSVTEPFFRGVPVTAYRCLSLLSPNKDGDDDYFSSDFDEAHLKHTFGAFTAKTPLLLLWSGSDEHVPAHIDVPGLLKRWTGVVESAGGVVNGNSGIVKGAHHNLNEDSEEIVSDLCMRVHNFAQAVSSSD